MAGKLDVIDRFQQRHAALGVPFAVYKKFGDDRAGNLAALIAYYAFFSIFPLLLALVTILGYVLAGHPDLEKQVFNSALGNFPIIGKQGTFKPLTGSIPALVIGLALAIWSGLAVAQTAQTAFNTLYHVPLVNKPGFVPRLLRSIQVVLIVGVGLIFTTLLQGIVSGSGSYGLDLSTGLTIAGAILGIVLNTFLLALTFRRLTVADVSWREALPGAVVAAIGWFILQKVGTYLVNSKVNGAQGTYGTFAFVIGLLGFFYLLAQITLYCAEINVVLSERLWPRGLQSMKRIATTEADARAYRLYPQRERQAKNMRIDITVDDSGAAGDGRAADGGDHAPRQPTPGTVRLSNRRTE
jgi:YihY family inner membrane protein